MLPLFNARTYSNFLSVLHSWLTHREKIRSLFPENIKCNLNHMIFEEHSRQNWYFPPSILTILSITCKERHLQRPQSRRWASPVGILPKSDCYLICDVYLMSNTPTERLVCCPEHTLLGWVFHVFNLSSYASKDISKMSKAGVAVSLNLCVYFWFTLNVILWIFLKKWHLL